MAHVFISCTPSDEEIAINLAYTLAAQGEEIWITLQNAPPSDKWHTDTEDVVNQCDYLVIILTERATTDETIHAYQVAFQKQSKDVRFFLRDSLGQDYATRSDMNIIPYELDYEQSAAHIVELHSKASRDPDDTASRITQPRPQTLQNWLFSSHTIIVSISFFLTLFILLLLTSSFDQFLFEPSSQQTLPPADTARSGLITIILSGLMGSGAALATYFAVLKLQGQRNANAANTNQNSLAAPLERSDLLEYDNELQARRRQARIQAVEKYVLPIVVGIIVGVIVAWLIKADRFDPTRSPQPTDTPLDTPSFTQSSATSTPVITPDSAACSQGGAVGNNDDWNPTSQEVRNGMVFVPTGVFTMGSETGEDNERSPHPQCVQGFWIDVVEVTQDMFIDENGEKAASRRFTEPRLPVTEITWAEALAFCESRGARLPTELEWEYAARGPNNLIYPWGNDWRPTIVSIPNQQGRLNAVETYPENASWVGAFDMAGNAQEWVSSLAMAYPYDRLDARERVVPSDIERERVVRGGYEQDTARTSARLSYDPETASPNIGFRCARDA